MSWVFNSTVGLFLAVSSVLFLLKRGGLREAPWQKSTTDDLIEATDPIRANN